MILIFFSYIDIKDFIDQKNFKVNNINVNQDKNQPISINKNEIMFSMMFEDKKLQSDFEKYFKIQYVN